MIMWAELPKEALDDPFKPPDEACRVRCLHCKQEYSSDEIVWRPRADGGGFWCCPIEGCGGAGFGFDIHPVDSPLWADDEEEYAEDEDDEHDEQEG